jgi:Leucine-rich repeat (LRR) protein
LGFLYLYSNALTGSIPSTIGNLKYLEGLILYSNALTGSIPSTIGNLRSLGFLYLSYNALTGDFLEVLPTSLEVFIVSDCLLTGKLFLVYVLVDAIRAYQLIEQVF